MSREKDTCGSLIILGPNTIICHGILRILKKDLIRMCMQILERHDILIMLCVTLCSFEEVSDFSVERRKSTKSTELHASAVAGISRHFIQTVLLQQCCSRDSKNKIMLNVFISNLARPNASGVRDGNVALSVSQAATIPQLREQVVRCLGWFWPVLHIFPPHAIGGDGFVQIANSILEAGFEVPPGFTHADGTTFAPLESRPSRIT